MLFSLSCKTKKHSSKENTRAKIVFGEGGGFVGSISQYVIFEDGQVLFDEGFESGMVDKGTIKKKEVKIVLKELKELDFTSIDYHHPGNVYQYIGLQLKDSMHTVMWPLNDTKVNAAIPALYKKLTSLVTESNE